MATLLQHVGCDFVLGSNATFDACGVCNGDNSTCETISGSYNDDVRESGEKLKSAAFLSAMKKISIHKTHSDTPPVINKFACVDCKSF